MTNFWQYIANNGNILFNIYFFSLHRWMLTPYFNISLPLAAVLGTFTFFLEFWKISKPSNLVSGSIDFSTR